MRFGMLVAVLTLALAPVRAVQFGDLAVDLPEGWTTEVKTGVLRLIPSHASGLKGYVAIGTPEATGGDFHAWFDQWMAGLFKHSAVIDQSPVTAGRTEQGRELLRQRWRGVFGAFYFVTTIHEVAFALHDGDRAWWMSLDAEDEPALDAFVAPGEQVIRAVRVAPPPPEPAGEERFAGLTFHRPAAWTRHDEGEVAVLMPQTGAAGIVRLELACVPPPKDGEHSIESHVDDGLPEAVPLERAQGKTASGLAWERLEGHGRDGGRDLWRIVYLLVDGDRAWRLRLDGKCGEEAFFAHDPELKTIVESLHLEPR